MTTEKYLRDGRAPVPKLEHTSRIMRANKHRDTKPELTLRKGLWFENLKGYRFQTRNLPGRPDISYTKHKVAIFVNGCFWHRCPHCNSNMPKSNTIFWKHKFETNVERDKSKVDELYKHGWKCLVIWECEIKNSLSTCLSLVRKSLK